MMYPGLTQGAIAAIHEHGSDEQKAKFLPKMVEGIWTGTMNLTEPHCGTDLGLLRTKAVPQVTAATRFPARRSSSRPASTTCPTTSSIWFSPASRARRKG
jgi:acyl-CoA dehydrogenase